MKFQVSKRSLNEALRKVGRVIRTNAVIPVLTGVHLNLKDGRLTLTGSDSQVSVRVVVEDEFIDVDNEGHVVLPAREFINIVRAMPDNSIEIEQDDLRVNVSSKKSNFTLNGINGNEYPEITSTTNKKDAEEIVLKGNILKNLINKTAYATSDLETRPVLAGVNVFFENNQMGMVATDSHRLSKIMTSEYEGEPFEDSIVIPEATLKVLSPLLDDDAKVSVKRNEHQVSFETDNMLVVSRIIDGNYPETDRLIPVDHSTTIKVNRDSFLSSIERSSILADRESGSVIFTINGKSENIFESIELSHQNSELGESKEDIIVNEIEGEEVTLSFNPGYMIDALKAISEEDVEINFNGQMRPFVIHPKGNDRFTQLILPVRVY